MNIPAPTYWRRFLAERPLLLSGLIFAIALLPRLVAIGRYITPDELIWVYRSINFMEAIRSGEWVDTLQAGHPGVTTMWLGSLGTMFQLLLRPADEAAYRWITQLAWLTPDNMLAFKQLSVFLTSGRVTVGLVNSLGIVAVYWMGRALLSGRFAALFVLFLLLDPFLTGLSGILHVDGLATTFATISLLALALSISSRHAGSLRSSAIFAAASGAGAGLAVLSKSPLLLLVPFSAFVFLLSLWQNKQEPLAKRFERMLLLGLVWLGAFVLLLFLLFPALWVSPVQVLQTVGSNANRHVEEALRPTFFMGNVAYEHGPLFYPIALVWRMGLLTTLGLMLLLFLVAQSGWRKRLPRFLLALLIVWVLLFIAGISVAAKKFDRYALPAVPALILLAAIAWSIWLPRAKRWQRWLFSALLIVQLLYALFVLPYPLSAYNLLLGGPYSARYVLPIGWGEGVSRAGSWLSANMDAESRRAVSGIAPSLAPFFTGGTLLADEDGYETADYVIGTLNGRQMNDDADSQRVDDRELLKAIRFGGLEQAWIYQNPTPEDDAIQLTELAHPVSFGSQMQLMAQQLTSRADAVYLSARWNAQRSEEKLLVKLRLLDSNGNEWSDLETALLNEHYFFPEHWGENERPVVTYRLKVPPAIPPGDYALEMSVVDMGSGAQLPLLGGDGTFQGVSYDVGEIAIAPRSAPVEVQGLAMVPVAEATWDGDALRLLGHGELPERVVQGGEIILDLFWEESAPFAPGLQLALSIDGNEVLVEPISNYDSGLWQPGDIIQEKYRLPVPASLDAGNVAISLMPLTADGSPLNGAAFELGSVEVQSLDRLFTLPDVIELPLDVNFGPAIGLRGANLDDFNPAPGDTLSMILFWQTNEATEAPVTAFVHLVDRQGNIVTQSDRWPGGLPSNTWAANQVIVDEYELILPDDLVAGDYQIMVGLYDGESGRRLPAVDNAGEHLPNNSVQLPVIIRIGS